LQLGPHQEIAASRSKIAKKEINLLPILPRESSGANFRVTDRAFGNFRVVRDGISMERASIDPRLK
jgi:hypothetical protein